MSLKHMTQDPGPVVVYTGSALAVFLGLTLGEWAAIVGIICAIGGLAFNIWFKMKYGRPSDPKT